MPLPPLFRRLVIVVLALCLAACGERLYFYYPSQEHLGTPDAVGLAHRDVYFSSRDGTRLHGWFIPAKGRARATVVHFHGNTKNIGGHLRYVEWLPELGFNLFLFDYRGFGESEGSPYPAGLVEDGIAALRKAGELPGVDPQRLVVLAQSLGGSYALAALARYRQGVRAVAVEGTFTRHRAVALENMGYTFLPNWVRRSFIRVMVGDEYDAQDQLSALAGLPLLFIHGSADQTVPVWHGDALFAAAAQPKQYWRIDGGEHLDTFVYRPVPFRRRLADFYADALAVPPTAGIDSKARADASGPSVH